MRRFGRPGIGVAVLILTVGCGNPSGPGLAPAEMPTPNPRDAAAPVIQDAVHRRQFVEYLRQPQREGPITYCLARSVETESPFTSNTATWTDAAEPLIRQFAGHQPPVKRVSVCQIQPNLLVGAIDLETGGRAVIFRATSPIWESDAEVVVHGAYFFSGLSGSGETYRLRFEGGRWVIVAIGTNWIS